MRTAWILRRRLGVWASAAVATILTVAGCASSSSPSATPPSAVPPTIKAAFMPQVKASVLETSDGFALYIFQIDNRGKPTCFGTCAQVWPPVLLGPGQSAVAGSGVQASLLGSESYSNGKSVVTYAGWPLYKYVSDTTPGVAAGQGLDLNGGFWYVMRPNGQPIVPPGDPPVP